PSIPCSATTDHSTTASACSPAPAGGGSCSGPTAAMPDPMPPSPSATPAARQTPKRSCWRTTGASAPGGRRRRSGGSAPGDCGPDADFPVGPLDHQQPSTPAVPLAVLDPALSSVSVPQRVSDACDPMGIARNL